MSWPRLRPFTEWDAFKDRTGEIQPVICLVWVLPELTMRSFLAQELAPYGVFAHLPHRPNANGPPLTWQKRRDRFGQFAKLTGMSETKSTVNWSMVCHLGGLCDLYRDSFGQHHRFRWSFG